MVGTAVFNPMSGVVTQLQTVTITFIDDDIALEDDQIIRFSLNNSMGTTINGQAVDVIVKDDDGMFHGSHTQYIKLFTHRGHCPVCISTIQLQRKRSIC